MAQKTLTARKPSTAPQFVQEATVTLPDGRVLTHGMIVTITGRDGVFKFKYGRRNGQEVTVFGGTIAGEKSDHAWHSFRPEQIASAGANLVTEAIVAKVEANKPAEWADMSAGQKAAYTRRMNLAAKAQPIAA